MGEYYRHHVPSEPVECPCGAQYQSRKHILQDCPRYEAHRNILRLREASETIDLPTILGTEEGIDALAHFIEKSGAFTKTGEPRAAPEGAAEPDDDEEAAEGDDHGGDDPEPEEDPDGSTDDDEG
ncbi:hypothetical protein EVJ58_g5302 [Rhodofomes roseus]|uniref:Uncharacterized protein n=1 Tax=Rhodofomes roseus TaxID=34475 RepID=A0A4Y9YE99_9APHY|nr:hypothetical protein EVJ58_g5302 [Rhodofomes roseus]